MRHVADVTLYAHCLVDDDRPTPVRSMRRLRVFRLVGETVRNMSSGGVPGDSLCREATDAVVVAVESKRLSPDERASFRDILDRHLAEPFDLVICSPVAKALPIRAGRPRLKIVQATVADFLRQLAETGRFVAA